MFAVGLTQVISNMVFVFTVKLFPALLESVGFDGTFFAYACVCAVMVVWGAVSIPSKDATCTAEVERRVDGV